MAMMFVLGILLGVALVVLGGLHLLTRMARNPTPRFDAPGTIWDGSLMRFVEVATGLFPEAPARSYVSLGPKLALREPASHETCFYIRSLGKRGGVHRFGAELRLSDKWMQAAERAEALMAQIDPAFTREEKSYGKIILMAAEGGDLARLIGAAERFVTDVLGKEPGAGLHVQWHWAGYNGR